jgi:TRAP-type mannitol/chloroaromatic compound transport system permease small subunit
VDVIYKNLPLRVRALLDILTSAFFFLFVAVLVWKGGEFALESFTEGKRSSEAMGWPLYPSQMMIPAGGFLIALQGLAKLVRDIAVLVKGVSPE